MVEFSRVRAQPSKETFKIKPIAALLTQYVGDGKGWVDPFAGNNSPAEFTNDHNPDTKAGWHLDAEEFCQYVSIKYIWKNTTNWPIVPWPPFNGVLFDPPYSYRQITEHYKFMGMKASQLDTSSNFYNRVMNAICDAIRPGGLAISFGWNSNGFGTSRGFEPIEVLLVPHGSHHNDTIVTVERKFPKGGYYTDLIEE